MSLTVIVILFLLGLLLILVEIFISPGFIAGVIGVISMAIAIYMTFELYGENKGWAFLCISLAVVVGTIFWALRSGLWNKLALNEDVTSHIHVNDDFAPELDMEGIALSTLRPSGKAEFSGKAVEVHAESDFIDAKSAIKIIKILDNRIFVKKI